MIIKPATPEQLLFLFLLHFIAVEAYINLDIPFIVVFFLPNVFVAVIDIFCPS